MFYRVTRHGHGAHGSRLNNTTRSQLSTPVAPRATVCGAVTSLCVSQRVLYAYRTCGSHESARRAGSAPPAPRHHSLALVVEVLLVVDQCRPRRGLGGLGFRLGCRRQGPLGESEPCREARRLRRLPTRTGAFRISRENRLCLRKT